MKKILTLSITALTEELYIAFMLFVYNALDLFEELSEKLEYYVNQFKGSYDHMNRVYLKYDQRFYTKEVQKQDTERMNAFRKLRDMVRYNVTYPEDAAKGEAAGILLEIINLYGGTEITKKKMSERTTVLTNLIEDYEGKYNKQVVEIGVGTLLDELKQAQAKFDEVYMERAEFDSEIGLKAMADARKRMDEAYRDLVTVVNLAAKRDDDGKFTGFIDLMNVEIRKNFIHTGQKPASAGGGNAGSGAGSEEEQNPLKSATFKFADGTELKKWFVPGEPLEAPANTEGYRWDPEVPEFMPKRGTTFREVPLATEKFTATFHFADHHEEEIREVVGAILHAPHNTTGYVWYPAVPATMPAEDTSYYEMLATENGGSGSGGGSGSTETPTDPTKILLLFNDGAHGNVIVKRMEVAPGYQLTASDLPEGFVYAFKADDQADIDAASPGDTVWVTLAPRG